MVAAILICVIYVLLFWLVFFVLKWIRFTITWAAFSTFFVIHLFFVFIIGLRFVTPYSTDARVIQHTIQIVPRLTEPTLVTDILVQPDMPVKKGQRLFRFDNRPYLFKVQKLKAQLAQAKQNVKVLEADMQIATHKLSRVQSESVFAKYQQNLSNKLAAQGAGSAEEAQRGETQLNINEATVKETSSELERTKLNYQSRINGVNTTVAMVEAELAEALYFLDNTTIYAPEDGRIINLQVRPGMVAGDYRVGAIASFICDSGRYLLANYNQESLKYVKPGQIVEVALDLYPGQIFPAKVEAIWKANGVGQLLPSGTIPDFEPAPPKKPQGEFAVKISFNGTDQSGFPIGTQGASAIYTNGLKGPWAALRRISIRTYSWLNWLYPIPF
ncbi:MAG TPA: biotin/lipoyl-binding protein [Puia sp.]